MGFYGDGKQNNNPIASVSRKRRQPKLKTYAVRIEITAVGLFHTTAKAYTKAGARKKILSDINLVIAEVV
jgi:hypothetical protein